MQRGDRPPKDEEKVSFIFEESVDKFGNAVMIKSDGRALVEVKNPHFQGYI